MCRFASVLLIISVVFSLTSCKKVEAEYVLRFTTIDDYMLVFAWKFDARESKNIEVNAVFHNEKNIGTITEDKGLLNRVYKHN